MWTVLSATLRSRQKVEVEEGRLSVSSCSDSWHSDSESIKYKNFWCIGNAFLSWTLITGNLLNQTTKQDFSFTS
jgi:hypothetical protein